MQMNIFVLGKILEQANKNDWDRVIPLVSMRLRIAIDSLASQAPKFWEHPPEDLHAVIVQDNNARVRAILEENHPLTIAFAIRDARMAAGSN